MNQDERRTSDLGAVIAQPPARGGRSWLVLGAATVLIAVVLLLRAQPRPPAGQAEPLIGPPTPHVEARAAAPTEPLNVPVASATARSAAAPSAAAPSVAPPLPSVTSLPPAESRTSRAARELDTKSSPRRSQPAPRRASAPTSKSEPEPAPTQPVSTTIEAVSSPTSTTSALGRSEEIERLIEERR